MVNSNQILHSDKDHQMPFVCGPNTRSTNPIWRTAAILQKSQNHHISAVVNFDEIWHDDAIRPS